MVLVTGGNRGIGLEHVRQALAAGDAVIACCRAPEAASDLIARVGAEDSGHFINLTGERLPW